MNKKIYLAFLPPWGDGGIPPLGIPSITPRLVHSGFEVIQKDYDASIYAKVIANLRSIFYDPANIYIEENYKRTISVLLNHYMKKWVGEFLASDAPLIGFTVNCMNFFSVKKMSEMIKERDPGRIIITGGPEAGERCLECKAIDFAVAGEGEETLTELAEAVINEKAEYREIKGIFYRDKDTGKIIYTGNRPAIRLDDQFFPDFRGFDFTYSTRILPIEGSRGCINRCAFCTEVTLHKGFRYKSGEKLFKEISHFAGLGFREFAFLDSLINGNTRELEKFCDMVIENRLGEGESAISWAGNACIREQMTPVLLSKMKKAGCSRLTYGIESGSDEVLKMMNKRLSAETASRILQNTSVVGIKVYIYLIIGFPTETEKDFLETLDFVAKNRNFVDFIFAGGGCSVVPDSDLAKNPKKYGIFWCQDNSGPSTHAWNSKSTTPEIRKERVRRFVEHCQSINIPCESF